MERCKSKSRREYRQLRGLHAACWRVPRPMVHIEPKVVNIRMGRVEVLVMQQSPKSMQTKLPNSHKQRINKIKIGFKNNLQLVKDYIR